MTTGPHKQPPVPGNTAPEGEKVPALASRQRQRMGSYTQAPEPAAPQKQRIGSTPSIHLVAAVPRQRLGGSAGASDLSADRAAVEPVPASSSGTRSSASGTAVEEGALAAGSRSHWVRPVVAILGTVVVGVVLVVLARWIRTMPAVQEFIATYPGHSRLPESSSEGIPAWLGWQHFLNMFFLVLIVRTGLQVRGEKRAPGYWKPKVNSFFSPKGNTPKKVSLSQWLHQVLDVLWVANGVVFILLLAVTGHWARIVPTSLDIFPNMVSAAIQYASLDWPLEKRWVHYNALQMAAYFLTVFVAAPVAVISGLRMSTWWPAKAGTLNRIYPLEIARALHFPVMLYFVAFTVIHVFLVFFTGALGNLNHMYTSRDVVDWWGLGIFVVSILVIAAAWFLTKPVFTTPLATRMGTVTKN
ncbi:hypothetical protein GCM10009712_37960 [Pseudarthrobacter sulfonivorans]|uniref:cytochrome b/b6 domain-containing protein n=1 Tax=Pseudarthrobacter sulfonivorans TaxID=121292 RepID=UPI001CC2D544|nr:cytochrome b/b6 domain-containing protein [Pseudarthrobacter sulfonivorans]